MTNHGNILLSQIIIDGSLQSFKEIIPFDYTSLEQNKFLMKDSSNNLSWVLIDLSTNIIVNNKFLNTNIYYEDTRLGIGRFPLFNYKVDIAVEKNKRTTALHIGDGKYGFSFGNGTDTGFLPEIIGIGSDETDAGLYFLGMAGNNLSSDTPIIVFDGRDSYGEMIENRPIIGFTSGNYNEYLMTLENNGDLIIQENIYAKDLIIDNISLRQIIEDLQREIDELKTKIT